MKNLKIITKFLMLIFCINSINLLGQSTKSKNLRWDEKMISEAPIWQNLLVNYMNAEYKKCWPDRKSALEKVIQMYPSSEWADDAALLLAGGKASFEHNITGAIKDLREIIKKYPKSSTIVGDWNPSTGFRLNEGWIMWVPSLVSLNNRGEITASIPFDSDSIIDTKEQEALYYFEHLENHPHLTKDKAEYTIALMFITQVDNDDAISELEGFLEKNSGISEITKNDFDASKDKNGYLIEHEPPFSYAPIGRVQYDAIFKLCELYMEKNEFEKADSLLQTFLINYSSEGWLWNYNLYCGVLFLKMNKIDFANKQFDIAESGIKIKFKRNAERLSKLAQEGNVIMPNDFVSWEKESAKFFDPVINNINNFRQKAVK